MWIVQSTGVNVSNCDRVMTALMQEKIPFVPVGVLPFTAEITGLDGITLPDRVYVYGSTKLIRIAGELNLTPGVFFDHSTFNMMVWADKLASPESGIDFLNSDCSFFQIRELAGLVASDTMFIRPVMDLKAFSGQVINAGECFDEFFSRVFNSENYNRHMMVAIGGCKDIDQEYRVFMVGRKPVTASRYRDGGELSLSSIVPDDVFIFADKVAKTWLPHDHCVLDVARTASGYSVLEFNCINASGLYDADVNLLVKAINNIES